MTEKWKFTTGMTKGERMAMRLKAEYWRGEWNTSQKVLVGTKANQKKAQDRLAALLGEYDAKRSAGVLPDEAMTQANDLLSTYDFEPYSTDPPKHLKALLKKHRPNDWL